MTNESISKTTFAVATLGCKVNQADSETISEQMSAAGFVQRDFSEIVDVYIVNTCTVTHLGDRSSRQMISQARRRHPDALLVVTGCYAELNPQVVSALPGVNLVIGNSGKESLVDVIKEQWKATPMATANPIETSILETSIQLEQREHNRILPILQVETQHIGSDSALPLFAAVEEPQP